MYIYIHTTIPPVHTFFVAYLYPVWNIEGGFVSPVASVAPSAHAEGNKWISAQLLFLHMTYQEKFL
jgi:hypothetical protein